MHRSLDRSRSVGLGAGVLAGLVWGLAFLLPVLLHGWSPVAVTAGRYLAYGALSVVLIASGGRGTRRIARRHWRPALAFALTGNVAYYLLLVLGITWTGAPVTDIIVGCIPITIAVVGNIISRAYRWQTLAFPVLLVCVGLALVNALVLTSASPVSGHGTATVIGGMLAAFGAVALWTWYGLANATFVQRHPEVSSAAWSAVTGLGTGAVTLVALPFAIVAHQFTVPTGAARHGLSPIEQLLLASVVLGVLVSWAATVLWNSASARMSSTAAGMLINIETVSGYTYVYAAAGHWPPIGQLAGFALILIGVGLIIRLPVALPDDSARIAHTEAASRPSMTDRESGDAVPAGRVSPAPGQPSP